MHIWPRNAHAEDWGQNPKQKNCISLVLTLMLILTMTMMMFITSMCKVRHRQDGALVPYQRRVASFPYCVGAQAPLHSTRVETFTVKMIKMIKIKQILKMINIMRN